MFIGRSRLRCTFVIGTEKPNLVICLPSYRYELMHLVLKWIPLLVGFPWIIRWVSLSQHVLYQCAKADGEQHRRDLDPRAYHGMG